MRNYHKTLYGILLLYVLLTLFIWGCDQNEDFENPLDPRNERTNGSPPGLTLSPGDEQIIVSWSGLGFKGITRYKIYRRFTGDAGSVFELVGEVPVQLDPITGREVRRYEYVDASNLENDTVNPATSSQLYYVYRITYIDGNGEEIPKPEDVNTLVGIPEAQATPSLAPPPLEVTIGPPEDLRVKLVWTSYQPPDDIAGYKIYGELVVKGPELKLLADLPIDPIKGPLASEQFYVDFDFIGDKITKAYKVIAYDKFGVESTSEAFQATSPNLPPATPKVQARYTFPLFSPTYLVDFSWQKNRESDLKGYRIYRSTEPERGVWERVKTLDKNVTHFLLRSERYLIIDGDIVPRQYQIVAYDKTPGEDGKDDESLPAIIIPPEG